MSNFVELSGSDGSNAQFFVRWRGQQSGPFSAAAIEAKLQSHELSLLHEINHNGQWVTIREYLNAQETALAAERQVREEQQRREKDELDRQARERDEQFRAASLAEEKRRNDLLADNANRLSQIQAGVPIIQPPLKPHRGALILTLGLLGFFVCGPLCIAAWIMGSGDISEMDAGIMDPSGRSTTATGKIFGRLGTILWIICFVVLYLMHVFNPFNP